MARSPVVILRSVDQWWRGVEAGDICACGDPATYHLVRLRRGHIVSIVCMRGHDDKAPRCHCRTWTLPLPPVDVVP